MKKNRKNHHAGRIISLFIVLCMVLAIAPITAFAGVEDITGDTPSAVYKYTYHTKVKMTANVTIQDSEGNTVNTYPVSEESDDFLVGNVSDDAVQAEITRLEAVVNSQLPSGAVKSNSTTKTTFDHFESSIVIDMRKDDTLVGDNAQEEGGVTSILDVHEYQIYEITDEWTVKQDDYVIHKVVINNAPVSCTMGEAPKAMATKGDNGAYTFYEYWEEWAETENGMEPVKYWYSDEDRMSRIPEDQKITTFEEGKNYSYSVVAEANEYHIFASQDNLSVTRNGEDYTDKSELILDGYGLMIGPAFMTPKKPATQKEIPVVEINNATLTFKDGDKPVFTGTTPDDAPYVLVFEEWRTDGEWTRSDEWFNDADHHGDDKDITAFDKNKSYNYNLYIKNNSKGAAEGWYFGPNTKLKINGKEVSFTNNDPDVFMATTSITMTPAAESASPYIFLEGANGTWMQDSDGTLTVRANGDFSKFTGVKVDGMLIDAKNYTAKSGSTIVTLSTDYLKSLSVGTHNLTVVFLDGECSTNFEVKKAASEQAKPTQGDKSDTATAKDSKDTTSPKTGDNSKPALWFALLAASVLGIAGTSVYSRRKRVK